MSTASCRLRLIWLADEPRAPIAFSILRNRVECECKVVITNPVWVKSPGETGVNGKKIYMQA